MIMNPINAEITIDAHNPFIPSIMLNALIIPVTQNTVKGMPRNPN